MSRKSHEKRIARRSLRPATRPWRSDRDIKYALLCLCVAALAFVGYLAISEARANARRSRPSPSAAKPKPVRKAQTLDGLLKMTSEQLKDVDIAEMNLLCATGLPGSEKLDIDRCLARLDDFAARVRFDTDRHFYRVTDPRYADHYKHSATWFQAEMLAQTLQEDCGVVYNMERVRNISFMNSIDQFIHGMIDDTNGGTCVSMPVIYIAVGRRLGYPLMLVSAKAHLFARWEDGNDRFNVEVSTDKGVGSYTDEYYKAWPMKISEAELKDGLYLKSMTLAEELACFLAARGHCLLDNGRTKEAVDAYATAARYAPKEAAYRAWAQEADERLHGRPPPPRTVVRRPFLTPGSAGQPDASGSRPGGPGGWPGDNSGQGMNQPATPPMPQPPPPYPPQPGYPPQRQPNPALPPDN